MKTRAGPEACRQAPRGASQHKKTCDAFVGVESQFKEPARAADTESFQLGSGWKISNRY